MLRTPQANRRVVLAAAGQVLPANCAALSTASESDLHGQLVLAALCAARRCASLGMPVAVAGVLASTAAGVRVVWAGHVHVAVPAVAGSRGVSLCR